MYIKLIQYKLRYCKFSYCTCYYHILSFCDTANYMEGNLVTAHATTVTFLSYKGIHEIQLSI